jgi:hypothetical protein
VIFRKKKDIYNYLNYPTSNDGKIRTKAKVNKRRKEEIRAQFDPQTNRSLRKNYPIN